MPLGTRISQPASRLAAACGVEFPGAKRPLTARLGKRLNRPDSLHAGPDFLNFGQPVKRDFLPAKNVLPAAIERPTTRRFAGFAGDPDVALHEMKEPPRERIGMPVGLVASPESAARTLTPGDMGQTQTPSGVREAMRSERPTESRPSQPAFHFHARQKGRTTPDDLLHEARVVVNRMTRRHPRTEDRTARSNETDQPAARITCPS